MSPVNVVIAHHEKIIRAACLNLLQPEKGIRVIGEARSAFEVIKVAARFKPHILLLDLNLFKRNGNALLLALRQKSPRTKVILLTHGASKTQILEALSHGALGYLEKKLINTFLAKAVRKVDGGEAWVPRKMVTKTIDRLACLTASQEGRKAALDQSPIDGEF
jgi:DNA-binding NarL/FixJ family response regulator